MWIILTMLMEQVEMDDKQFEELIITLISGFEGLTNSIKSLGDTLKCGGSIDISNDMKYNNINHDLDGIPLSSVHHPNNPEYKASKEYHWDDKVKMWRK